MGWLRGFGFACPASYRKERTAEVAVGVILVFRLVEPRAYKASTRNSDAESCIPIGTYYHRTMCDISSR